MGVTFHVICQDTLIYTQRISAGDYTLHCICIIIVNTKISIIGADIKITIFGTNLYIILDVFIKLFKV